MRILDVDCIHGYDHQMPLSLPVDTHAANRVTVLESKLDDKLDFHMPLKKLLTHFTWMFIILFGFVCVMTFYRSSLSKMLILAVAPK